MRKSNHTLIVSEIIQSDEAITADSALKVINAIKNSAERIHVVDFLNIKIINSEFLKPLAKFIINEASNRITVIGLDDNKRGLAREAFISARRVQ